MFVIGLTGGIASGKSAVAQLLADLGAEVIDADKVGHEAFLPDTAAWKQLTDTFGIDILGPDRVIDRGKLAEIVFGDPKALEQLNEIMHPMMHQMVEQKLEDMRSRKVEVVVLEATLLIEADWTDLVNEVWVVVATEDMVIDRLLASRDITKEQAKARIKSQMPIYEKAAYGDIVIENYSDHDELKQRVEELWENIKS